MAKRKGPNKSEAVREALKTMSSPKEIVAHLKTKGLKVSPQMVSTLKAKGGKTKKRRGRKPGKVAGSVGNGHTINVQALFAAKTLIAAAGGEAEALAALAVVKKLG